MAETKKKADKPEEAVEAPVETKTTVDIESAPKSYAGGLRIGAIVLWVLALAAEIVTILILRGTIYIEPERLTIFLLGGLILDAILVIVGAQLWKAANHKDPVSNKNKAKFWLWNNMGVIAAVVCFFPIIIYLLRDKDLDGKTKKLATIVAIIALLISGTASYDWNPVAEEDFQKNTETAMQELGDGSGNVYWTRFGGSYHLSKDCQTLTRTTPENLFQGTVEDAYNAKRTDPCDFCAGGGSVEAEEPAAAA